MNDLFGLLGRKLGHSLSKYIHNEVFNLLGKDAFYHLFEIEPDSIDKVLIGLTAIGAVGVNITIPYKCDVVKYMDIISKEATDIGAVNTIKFENGKMIGFNTDYFGFKMLLEKYKIGYYGKNITILGNGGAADSVLQFFIDNNCKKINIVTRNLHEAKLKYKSKDVIICKYSELDEIKNTDIIVNCTPCGMYPNINDSPVPLEVFKNYQTAIDLIYNPTETLFLKYAKEQGLKSVNGLFMLVAQAIAAEEIWNNIKIEEEIINKIYESVLYNQQVG